MDDEYAQRELRNLCDLNGLEYTKKFADSFNNYNAEYIATISNLDIPMKHIYACSFFYVYFGLKYSGKFAKADKIHPDVFSRCIKEILKNYIRTDLKEGNQKIECNLYSIIEEID